MGIIMATTVYAGRNGFIMPDTRKLSRTLLRKRTVPSRVQYSGGTNTGFCCTEVWHSERESHGINGTE